MDKQIWLENTYYGRGPGALRGPKPLFDALRKRGIDISFNDVKEWLKSQQVYTIYRQARKNCIYNPIIANYPGEVVQIDIMDLMRFKEYNHGFGYVLFTYDTFSKFIDGAALSDREDSSVVKELHKIILRLPFTITSIYWDKVFIFI